MEQEQLKIFYQHTVDAKKVAENVDNFLEAFKDIGDPKKTRIEILDRNEFDQNLSNKELLESIDDELREAKYNQDYNYYNLWIKDDKIIILGFAL